MGTLQQQSVLKGLQAESGDGGDDLLQNLFGQTAARYPDRIAIYYEDETSGAQEISYKELDTVTNRLARVLRKYRKSDGPGSFVAVCMKPSDRLPTVLLAIVKSGMAYLPLDAEFPMSRVKHVLEEAEPVMVLVEEEVDTSIYDGTLTMTYTELLEKAREEPGDGLETEGNGEQLAIVLYTSGSTGVPKGVLLPHATILNRLRWQWRELPYAEDEQLCIFKTSLTFVDSVPEIWGPLLQGRTLVIVPKQVTRDPEMFVQVLEKHKIQRLVLVPSLLRSVLMYLGLQDRRRGALETLRLWICSGETLAVSLAEQFFATFEDERRVLANFYGSTEIMGDVTYHLMTNAGQLRSAEKVPIGKPVDNCIVYLVNKDMRLVPQGEVGELVVAGRNLAAGYIRDRDSHKFQENPHAIDPEYSRIFRTGDYARISKGLVIYEGRVDAQIKVRGHRVDLAEVERTVSRVADVDKAVVLCYKPGELSQALLAFVTLKERDSSTTGHMIEAHLQTTLPPYMLPQVVVVDVIPLLTNGKTDRQALLKLYESSNVNDDANQCMSCDYTGVQDVDLEKAKVLFPTVATVIGRSGRAAVTLNANFYELGGNSLNSIYTVTKLRDQGYGIGITEFLTAKSLGEVLARMKVSTDEESLREALNEEEYVFEMLNDSHKEDTIAIITESFYSKADLEQWLIPDIDRDDYRVMMEALWAPLVEKNLSFAVKSSADGRMIGVGLNFDLWDEPEVALDSKLSIVFDFLEYLEGPIRERRLPKGKGEIIHNFMMTTSSDLSPAENVIMMRAMEEYCLRLAKGKEYAGIFTTNTSPLTQQLGTDVYGYETMLTYQVNQYTAPDGTRPFGKAPDSQLAICSLKMID